MITITIRDYAKTRGISYEAARKQVKRYRDAPDLEGHITQVDRTTYLDETATAFFDEKRQKNPVIVEQAADREELEILRKENAALRARIIDLQDALIQEKDRSVALLTEKAAYLTEKNTEEPQHRPWWQRIFGLQ